MEVNRIYIAIDLKSFYASRECIERGLDPLTTNLVVADAERTEKTICLAVTPSLKAYGIPGRPRLFEVVQKVREANALRRRALPGGAFSGSSVDAQELKANPSLAIDYIVAPPRMAHYVKCSTEIYDVYLKYVAAAQANAVATGFGFEEPAIHVVFLTENHDTRYEEYSVLRPLDSAG